jgi:hypothetical protein
MVSGRYSPLLRVPLTLEDGAVQTCVGLFDEMLSRLFLRAGGRDGAVFSLHKCRFLRLRSPFLSFQDLFIKEIDKF